MESQGNNLRRVAKSLVKGTYFIKKTALGTYLKRSALEIKWPYKHESTKNWEYKTSNTWQQPLRG